MASIFAYKIGDDVNVTGSIPGYIGAFHRAKVVSYVDIPVFYEVTYQDLHDEVTIWTLTEVVHGMHLRPNPPAFDVPESYQAKALVEVWAKDAWWVGFIKRKVDRTHYEIDFDHFNYHEMVVKVNHIRPHLHWTGQMFTDL